MKNCELHIAGRETDGKALSSIIAGMPNKADIHVHGELSRDEVRQLLYSSDALVLASRSEVQPLVLMEAMSTGMPVVATTAAPMSLRIPGACFTAAADSALSLMEAMTAVQAVTPSPVISHAIERMASPETVAQKLETLFTETLETL
jgi:glycosyltransferase involved in cell wall biosynthesis